MNSIEYKCEIEALKNHVLESLPDTHNGSKRLQKALMSASLYRLMPQIDVKQHDSAIKNIVFFQKWAARDQRHIGLLKHMVIEGTPSIQQPLPSQPTIFCSFHLGSYRLLVPYLISKGVKFSLLIDANVAAAQAKDFMEVIEATKVEYRMDGECCRILDTAQSNVALTMLKELKRGRSLLIFIDGNTGVDGKSAAKEKLSRVRFMGDVLYSRKGVAYMAYMARVSITPLLTYRDPDDIWTNKLKFFPPIISSPHQEREGFVEEATQAIYAILEHELGRVFEQWESWHYVEKSLVLATCPVGAESSEYPTITPETSIRFNASRYLLSRLDEAECLLLDRSSYISHFISADLMEFLEHIEGTAQPVAQCMQRAGMSPGGLKIMLEKGIVKIAN